MTFPINYTVKIIGMLVCIVVTALTLNQYAQLIQHLLSLHYNSAFELMIVTGMLIFQYPFIHKMPWPKKLDYYFGMLLVSFAGSLMLWPLLILNHFVHCTDIVNLAWFFAVVLVMFFLHKRVVKQTGMPALISYTWIGYRLIILFFIV